MTIKLAMAMAPTRANHVCDASTRAWLDTEVETRWGSADLGAADLPELIDGVDLVVTSWGTPPLPVHLLARTDGPIVVAHAAGTVRRLLPEIPERVQVFSGGPRIARSVAEYCLGATLTLLRQLPTADGQMRRGGWSDRVPQGQELFRRSVGIVGASTTARAFIRLLAPFDVDLRIYDPYLSPQQVGELGGVQVELAECMRSDVVSVHVPDVPETAGLITRDLLAQVPTGGVVINSSRAAALDTQALFDEVVSNRLAVAADVFDSEPYQIPRYLANQRNLLLSPHIAGNTFQGRQDLVRYVIDEALRWLRHGIKSEAWVDPNRRGVTA